MKRQNLNKKGQSNGVVTGIIFGVAALFIAIIVALTITSTLGNSDLLATARTTNSVINETGSSNSSGYTLSGGSDSTLFVPGSFAITVATNSSDASMIIDAANYTVSNIGVVTNTSAQSLLSVNFTYTNLNKSTEETATDTISTNFTRGIDNVSAKVPTVLLVGAIVLILTILGVLVGVWQRMRIGSGGSL